MIESIGWRVKKNGAKNFLWDEANLLGDIEEVLVRNKFPVALVQPETLVFQNSACQGLADQLVHINLPVFAEYIWRSIALPRIADHLGHKMSDNVQKKYDLDDRSGSAAPEGIVQLCDKKFEHFNVVAMAVPDQIDKTSERALGQSGLRYELKLDLSHKLFNDFRDPKLLGGREWNDLVNPSRDEGFSVTGNLVLHTPAVQNYVCFVMREITSDVVSAIEGFNRWTYEEMIWQRNMWRKKITHEKPLRFRDYSKSISFQGHLNAPLNCG